MLCAWMQGVSAVAWPGARTSAVATGTIGAKGCGSTGELMAAGAACTKARS